MKQHLRRLLLWLLAWICGETPIVVSTEVLALIPIAKQLSDRQDRQCAPGTSGEWKRDRVYEQLLNTYPQISPKHLHLAILLARLT